MMSKPQFYATKCRMIFGRLRSRKIGGGGGCCQGTQAPGQHTISKLVFPLLFGMLSVLTPAAPAASIRVAFISWDVTFPDAAGQLDIPNETGPNSSGDPTAPVVSSLPILDLALTVMFSNGSKQGYAFSDFILNPFDGLSYESPTIPIGGMNPSPVRATLTGVFDAQSISLFDGSQMSIKPGFEAVLDGGGAALRDGDLAIIYAETTGNVITEVPEPSSALLAGILLFGLLVRLNTPLKRGVSSRRSRRHV